MGQPSLPFQVISSFRNASRSRTFGLVSVSGAGVPSVRRIRHTSRGCSPSSRRKAASSPFASHESDPFTSGPRVSGWTAPPATGTR